MNRFPDDDPYQAPAPDPSKAEQLPLIVTLLGALIVILAITFPFYRETWLAGTPFLAVLESNAPLFLLLSWGWCIGMMLLALHDYRRFLRDYPEIDRLAAIHSFRVMARQNMYLSLIQMPMLLLALVSSVMVFTSHGLPGVLAVAAGVMVFSSLGRFALRWETRTRELPVAAHFEQEYQRISHSWVHDFLPRF